MKNANILNRYKEGEKYDRKQQAKNSHMIKQKSKIKLQKMA